MCVWVGQVSAAEIILTLQFFHIFGCWQEGQPAFKTAPVISVFFLCMQLSPAIAIASCWLVWWICHQSLIGSFNVNGFVAAVPSICIGLVVGAIIVEAVDLHYRLNINIGTF